MSTARIVVEVARFLREHPGHAFCDDCLADRAQLAVRDVRHARIALAGVHEFDQETWLCSVCFASTFVIHVAWLSFDEPQSTEPAASDLGE